MEQNRIRVSGCSTSALKTLFHIISYKWLVISTQKRTTTPSSRGSWETSPGAENPPQKTTTVSHGLSEPRKDWHMKKRSTSTLLSTPSPLTSPDTLNVKRWWESQLALFHTLHQWSSLNYECRAVKNPENISPRLSAITTCLVKDQMEKTSALFQRKLQRRQCKRHYIFAKQDLKSIRISFDNEHTPHSCARLIPSVESFLAFKWICLAISVTRLSLPLPARDKKKTPSHLKPRNRR